MSEQEMVKGKADSAAVNPQGQEEQVMSAEAESEFAAIEPTAAPPMDRLQAQPPSGAGNDGISMRLLRKLQLPTWELELLISGAVVFALLRLPTLLDLQFELFALVATKQTLKVVSIGYIYLKVVLLTLILAFILHLASRAYWVGLVGLNSLYPKGINWDNAKTFPPRHKLFLRRITPELPALIARTNAFCSSIFSFSFLIVVVSLTWTVYGVGLYAAATVIANLLFGGSYDLGVFYALMLATILPMVIAQRIDKRLERKKLDVESPSALGRLVDRTYRWYSKSPTTRIFLPVWLVFYTNAGNRRMQVQFLGAFFGALLFVMVGLFNSSDILRWIPSPFFPEARNERQIEPVHYRDQWQEPELRGRSPSIQSQIVNDNYVQLFLPYRPRYQEVQDRLCKDAPELSPRSFGLRPSNPPRPDWQELETVLTCLSSMYEVFLDRQRVDLSAADFYRLPESKLAGLMLHIPVHSLELGRHELLIERHTGDKKEQEMESEDEPERFLFFIPFWI